MSDQLKAALLRAIIGAIVSAGSAFFAVLATADAGKAAIAAGSAFFGGFIARGFGEGTYDTRRARQHRTKPGDVS